MTYLPSNALFTEMVTLILFIFLQLIQKDHIGDLLGKAHNNVGNIKRTMRHAEQS